MPTGCTSLHARNTATFDVKKGAKVETSAPLLSLSVRPVFTSTRSRRQFEQFAGVDGKDRAEDELFTLEMVAVRVEVESAGTSRNTSTTSDERDFVSTSATTEMTSVCA